MDFKFTKEQIMLKNSVRDFVKKEKLKDLARELDETGEYPFDIHKKMAKLGWFGMGIPEEYGGSAGKLLDVFILVEELAKGAMWAGNIAFRNIVNAGLTILRNGSESQKKELLPKIIDGDLIFAFALTEPNAGSDASSITTTAEKDGDDYIINGNKVFCSGANVADFIQLVVKTKSDGPKYNDMSTFLVDSKTPGITIRKIEKVSTHVMETNEIFLDNVRVPAKNLLGKLNNGWNQIAATLAHERIIVSGICIGCTETVMEDAVEYAKKRVQFGRPISKFQTIRNRLVDMKVRLEGARMLCYNAVNMIEEGLPYEQACSIAKFVVSETYLQNSMEGIRVLGGYGVTMDYDMQRHMRDSLPFVIGAGTSDIMRNIIAKQMGL